MALMLGEKEEAGAESHDNHPGKQLNSGVFACRCQSIEANG